MLLDLDALTRMAEDALRAHGDGSYIEAYQEMFGDEWAIEYSRNVFRVFDRR